MVRQLTFIITGSINNIEQQLPDRLRVLGQSIQDEDYEEVNENKPTNKIALVKQIMENLMENLVHTCISHLIKVGELDRNKPIMGQFPNDKREQRKYIFQTLGIFLDRDALGNKV
jgi:hypothetical protein